MEDLSKTNKNKIQIIEFLSFSNQISETEILTFLESKGISSNDRKFIEFEDGYSNINNFNKKILKNIKKSFRKCKNFYS
jgi:hypothetical protein